eukprot:GHVP01061668.1.p1 GENE.GHVP01061668.1~~GHVP01061668.1.p1  ORF type:complete len:164 (+),score=30.00 GHVP01061668.1:185-676(+)
MEIKLLADQLSSALELFGATHGNIQDELVSSEPVFFSGNTIFVNLNHKTDEDERKLLGILQKDDPRFKVVWKGGFKIFSSWSGTFFAAQVEPPNWNILMCRCSHSRHRTSACRSSDCGKFVVEVCKSEDEKEARKELNSLFENHLLEEIAETGTLEPDSLDCL